jgi:hypothetical protein
MTSLGSRPNPKHWFYWLRFARFLPRRLIYGAVLYATSVAIKRAGVPSEDAHLSTVGDISRMLFDEWGW